MNTKQYLLQVKCLDEKIQANKEALDIQRAKLTSITSKLDEAKVQSSNQANFDETLADVIDLENKLERELSKYFNLKYKIINEINAMADNTLSVILFKRYVLNKTLAEIARELNYSYDHVRHLHGQALIEFRKHNTR